MKKILLTVAVLLLSASMTFAARNGGMDLVDIFGKNQLGAGYDGREWDTSLYSDFGTDKLRFSVNLWQIGGSWYNNGELTSDGSAVPFQNGMPRFFVGAGYKISDSFRAAIGYGGALKKKNKGGTDIYTDMTTDDPKHYKASGYYGHDVSVFVQANVGDSIIRFATPIEFGKGFGVDDDSIPILKGYNLKNVSVFSMKPEVRWIGQAGPLVQVRFAVPFGMGELKKPNKDISDELWNSVKVQTIGADLRLYFQFATDPVVVKFVPRFIYNQSLKGNHLSINAMTGFNNLTDDASALPNMGGEDGKKYYAAEKPWAVRVDLAIDLGASSDMISVWGQPQVRLYAAGSPKLMHNGIHRRTPLYGIGYALPLELTVRPIANLEFNIGMEVEATSPLYGGSADADAAVDGSIVWYF